MVQIGQIVQKYAPEVCKTVKNEVVQESAPQQIVQVSKVAGECVSNIQRGLMSVQKTPQPLNRHSFYATYFGVRSPKNIQEKLEHQMALSWLKAKELDIAVFPSIVLSSEPDPKGIQKALNKLKKKKFGRLTVSDKTFSQDCANDTHTIGIVYHKGKYIVLDSLSENYPQVKEYHARFMDFMGLDPKQVVFANKPQQSLEEYTCNNWTHANLEAVINYLKEGGADKELTPEVLDKILPDNINKILYHQYLYTDGNLKGRDLSEVVVEYFNKCHDTAK